MIIEKGCIIVMKAFGGYKSFTVDTDVVYDWIVDYFDDPELAANVSSWCELAAVGEVYYSREFTVGIVEVD